jgi:hypothetical protein
MGEQQLLERLRELADASAPLEPSPHIEAALLRDFEQRHPAHPTSPPRRVLWVPAIAASAALATAVTLLVAQAGAPSGERTRPPAADNAEELFPGFVAVPGSASLPTLESASIVRYELPVSALPAYGVEIVSDVSRRSVEADLLVGQDGYARAIRVVSVTSSRSRP